MTPPVLVTMNFTIQYQNYQEKSSKNRNFFEFLFPKNLYEKISFALTKCGSSRFVFGFFGSLEFSRRNRSFRLQNPSWRRERDSSRALRWGRDFPPGADAPLAQNSRGGYSPTGFSLSR
jgi:hypothetical protein